MMVKELEEATSRKLFGYAGYVQAEHDYEQITMGDQCETFCFDWASVDPVYLNTLEMAFLELALVFRSAGRAPGACPWLPSAGGAPAASASSHSGGDAAGRRACSRW